VLAISISIPKEPLCASTPAATHSARRDMSRPWRSCLAAFPIGGAHNGTQLAPMYRRSIVNRERQGRTCSRGPSAYPIVPDLACHCLKDSSFSMLRIACFSAFRRPAPSHFLQVADRPHADANARSIERQPRGCSGMIARRRSCQKRSNLLRVPNCQVTVPSRQAGCSPVCRLADVGISRRPKCVRE
jgi:hypothetical protein